MIATGEKVYIPTNGCFTSELVTSRRSMEITRKKWGPASTPSCPVPTIKDYTLQAISWLFFESFSTITLLLRKYLTQPNTILGNCIMGFEKQHARKYAAVDRLHFDTTKWVLTYFGGSCQWHSTRAAKCIERGIE